MNPQDHWPVAMLGEAVAHLAQRARLIEQVPPPTPPFPVVLPSHTAAGLEGWIERWAGQLGIETEAIHATYADVEALVQRAAPAILCLPANALPTSSQPDEGKLLILLKGGRRRVALLLPDLSVRWVMLETVCQWLCQPLEDRYAPALVPLLDRLDLSARERAQTAHALLQHQIGDQRVVDGWLLRLSPGAPLWQQLRHAQIQSSIAQLLSSYLAQLGLTALTWWMIGGSALVGQFAWAWLWSWALLLFTAIPLRLVSEHAQQKISETLALLLKQRLLYGVLRLQPEQIRHQGAGQFFGQVMEADNLDNLALGGGLTVGLAFLQAAMAMAILKLASPLWLLPVLLLAWLGLIGLFAWLYLKRQQAWIQVYRDMSSALVERMVGHRTRLAQALRRTWHDEEDSTLTAYTRLAQPLDQIKSWLAAIVARGWMVLVLSGLAATLWLAPAKSVNLPVALAGILLALQALTSVADGLVSLINGLSVWQQVKPLFLAATPVTPQLSSVPRLVGTPEIPNNSSSGNQPMVIGRDLEFRYQQNGRAIVHQVNLQIRRGDRLLLEGSSGSGKSTVAALIAGLRSLNAGLLLLYGYDQQTIGTALWRRRVVLVPQFHENYLFTGTLAFNLLMGHQWPPTATDLREAEQICQELGLGDLLARMPAGMQQMVGESGWRLSHGERSRLYIARALLQQSDLLILDESFAALDPENLQIALTCVLRRATTLLVIAHP